MSDDTSQPTGGNKFLRQSLEVTGQILIPTGAITALLYYFGYVRERAFFSYFGIDLGLVNFTTADYVLRSSQAVFLPLAVGFLVGTGVVIGHQMVLIRTRTEVPTWWRRAWLVVGFVAAGLIVIGATGLDARSAVLGPKRSSIALGVGALLVGYAAWMAARDPGLSTETTETLRESGWQTRLLLVGVGLIAAFWWTASAANQNGLATASAIQASLSDRREAVVLSKSRLGIAGSGVTVEELPAQTAGYQFRYTGLRVLIHTSNRWFLLPRGWTNSNSDTVILLSDATDGVRVDVRP